MLARMLRDVEYFRSRLGKIDGFEDAGEYLVSIIRKKVVMAPAPPPAPEPEPASSPPLTAATPSPAPASPTEGAEGKKSAEEQSTEPQAIEGGVEVEKNGGSNEASQA